MCARLRRASLVFTFMALITVQGLSSPADGAVTVPVGTVIPLRMDTYLSSRTARVGDTFSATVIRDVAVEGGGGFPIDDQHSRKVIPAGSKVEGHVRATERAERMSKAGMIAVVFDNLILANGTSVRIEGTLTSTDHDPRADAVGIDEDDQIEGGSRTRQTLVFIGAGAGVGAVIGAIAHGGKGAAVGAGVGAIIGTVGALLNRGEDAEINPGTEFAMRVERRFTINADMADTPDSRF